MSICTIFGYGLCIANSGMNEIVEVKLPATEHCESLGIEVLGRLHNATPGCGSRDTMYASLIPIATVIF